MSGSGSVTTPASWWSHSRPVFRAAAGALALALVLLAPPALAAPAPADGWTGTFGDAGNSMNDPGEAAITAANGARLQRAWGSSLPGGTVYAPPASGGVLYRMVTEPAGPYLAATSVRTGATLWTLHGLPLHVYWDALTVTGHYVIVAYDSGSARDPGGLLLIDTSTHRLVWDRPLPPTEMGWSTNGVAGVPYTDGTRIYVSGSSNNINTYRLSDGALLWKLPITYDQGTPARFDGFAVAHGVVYSAGYLGLVARDAATGRRLWSAANIWGKPVVAGNHVYGLTYPRMGHTAVAAFPAGGCGSATCSPQWRTDVGADLTDPRIGGADAGTLFVTFRTSDGGAVVRRLVAATGRIQWTAPAGDSVGDLVRGGNTIWLFEEYHDAPNSFGYRIVGFAAGATSTAPLRTIVMTDRTFFYAPQHLSIVGGSLLQKMNGPVLAAYRIPGT